MIIMPKVKHVNNYFSTNLQNIIKKQKTNCNEVADFCNIKRNTVYKWYRGDTFPLEKTANFLRLCSFLGVSPFEIMSKNCVIPQIDEPVYTDSSYYESILVRQNFKKIINEKELTMLQISRMIDIEYYSIIKYFSTQETNSIPDNVLDKIYSTFNLTYEDLHKMTYDLYDVLIHEKPAHINNQDVFTQNLRLFLKMREMPLSEFAKEINIPVSTANNWSRGVAVPRSSETVEKIALVLGVETTDLFCDYQTSLKAWICNLLEDYPSDEKSQHALIEFTKDLVNRINNDKVYTKND